MDFGNLQSVDLKLFSLQYKLNEFLICSTFAEWSINLHLKLLFATFVDWSMSTSYDIIVYVQLLFYELSRWNYFHFYFFNYRITFILGKSIALEWKCVSCTSIAGGDVSVEKCTLQIGQSRWNFRFRIIDSNVYWRLKGTL